ncbi:MAG: hypothetical protein IAG10_24320, partial [Planctomycetaceae bacterium]|nr:hypothetical protein [Planctomycetaceae bacterium]
MFRLAWSLVLSLGCWGCVHFPDSSADGWGEQTPKGPTTAPLSSGGTAPAAQPPQLAGAGTESWAGLTTAGPPIAGSTTLNLATAPRRPLPLQQAVLMGLQKSEIVRTLSGSVRIEPITTLDPAIADAELRKESARFDPKASAA